MIKEQLKQYRSINWRVKCDLIRRRDNNHCLLCGRAIDEGAQLQVHHLTYIKGCKPWEYPNECLITLCSNCHAKLHGHKRPDSGWIYDDLYDAGEFGAAQCELCGTQLRYVHTLHHPNWGIIMVGCECAETLQQGNEAERRLISLENSAKRYKSFVESPKWKHKKNCYSYEKDEKLVKIWENRFSFNIEFFDLYIDEYNNRKYYAAESFKHIKTLSEAKSMAFEFFNPENAKTTKVISKETLINLPKCESEKELFVKNMCISIIQTTMSFTLPDYKSIPQHKVSFINVQRQTLISNKLYDIECTLVGKDNKNYRFYILFSRNLSLLEVEKKQLDSQSDNFLLVDYSGLCNVGSISKKIVLNYLNDMKNIYWIKASVYDQFLNGKKM